MVAADDDRDPLPKVATGNLPQRTPRDSRRGRLPAERDGGVPGHRVETELVLVAHRQLRIAGEPAHPARETPARGVGRAVQERWITQVHGREVREVAR